MCTHAPGWHCSKQQGPPSDGSSGHFRGSCRQGSVGPQGLAVKLDREQQAFWIALAAVRPGGALLVVPAITNPLVSLGAFQDRKALSGTLPISKVTAAEQHSAR